MQEQSSAKVCKTLKLSRIAKLSVTFAEIIRGYIYKKKKNTKTKKCYLWCQVSIGWLVVVIFVSIELDGYKERHVWLFIQIKLIVFDSLAIWNIEKSNDSFCSRRGHKDIHTYHTEKLCILTSRIELSVNSEEYSFYYVLRISLHYAASPSPFSDFWFSSPFQTAISYAWVNYQIISRAMLSKALKFEWKFNVNSTSIPLKFRIEIC